MKVSKSLLASIAMAATMGFSAIASAVEVEVYGSLRAGYNQADTDDAMVFGDDLTIIGVHSAALNGVTTVAGLRAVLNDADEAAILEALDPSDDATAITDAEVAALAAYATQARTGDRARDANNIVNGIADGPEAPDAQLSLGHGQFGSRIGFRGSEDLGNGAEAGAHWEVNVGGAGETEGGRHANVWYSGAFGKITIGQQGNPYRNAANWDQSFWIGGNNRYGDGGSRLQGVRYDGSAGAFNWSVMGTAQNDDSNAAAASTVHVFAEGDSATGVGDADYATSTIEYAEVESETGIDSWIATGHYDMGVATINLGYRTDNNEAQAVGQAFDNFVISANGSLDALTWYVAFESNTDNTNVRKTDDLIGEATAGTAIHADDVTANDNVTAIADAMSTAHDTNTIGLFLGYNLSDVSTLYFEWEDSASDGLDYAGDNLDKTSTLLGFSRRMGPSTQFIAEYVSIDNGSEFDADTSLLQAYLRVDFN